MIRTTLNWTVKNLKSMNDSRHTLDFSHPIQRQSGQWDGDKLKKSLLIHSILANYPVPPIYCLKEPVGEKDFCYSILDGKQRLTTIFDFIDGRYCLEEETPSVTLDDVTYELGNKYFSDLDAECQQEILRFKFTIYGFEDADDDLIEEIFFRLNNSSPLSKPQKAMPLCGVENAKFIKSILADKFFMEICKFSAMQRRKSDDMCTLLQSMMLLDNRYYGYEYASISADEIMKYASHIKNNYSEEQKERLFDIIDYLEKVFPEQDKMLKKVNIPMVIIAADTAMGKDYKPVKNIYRVGPMYFRQWFSYFFAECYENYKQYCSSGSVKKEKTIKRIEIMEQSLKEYFELEELPTLEQQDDSTMQEEDSVEADKPLQEDNFIQNDDTIQKKDAIQENEQSEDADHSEIQKEEGIDTLASDSLIPSNESVLKEFVETDLPEKPPEEVHTYSEETVS